MDRISVPAYILASFSTGLHTLGSFRAYEESKCPKWYVSQLSCNESSVPGMRLSSHLPCYRLRVHTSQEWFDLYSEGC